MKKFYYVYIIDSISAPEQFYIGFTENLNDRLTHHNSGAVPSTARYRPWEYRTAISFKNRERALDFERYLKTHSGRAFLAKRL
jgi:putative endonuclease